jgi:hypothetical protein
MSYIKVNTDGSVIYPYTTLYADNPNVSLPSVLTDETLSQFGVFTVLPTEKPSGFWWQEVQEAKPVLQNNVWKQAWTITDIATADRDALIQKEWGSVRSRRNSLLLKSDWTQLADSPTDKAAWASYRQALRDLPKMTSNPFEAVWPEEPE